MSSLGFTVPSRSTMNTAKDPHFLHGGTDGAIDAIPRIPKTGGAGTTQGPVAAADQPSFGEKMGVGIGGLPFLFGSIGVQSLAIPIYQMMLGVNPALLGIVFAISRLWDAFTDPLMGKISDNFRSQIGRRRPFILFGALPMGILFAVIWMVSPEWTERTKLTYLLVTSILFYSAFTIFAVPFKALVCELSSDYDGRTSVNAHLTFWTKTGEFFYQWVFPLSQLGLFASAVAGVRVMGWGIGLILISTLAFIPGIVGKERYYKLASGQAKVQLIPALKAALKNRAFVVLVLLALSKVLASMLTSSMDHYILVYYMFGGDIVAGSFWKGVLSSGYAVMGFISLPLVLWLSRRFGKVTALMIIQGIVAIGGCLKWFLFVPGNKWLILLDPIFSGIIWVAIGTLLPSMMADICDDDELNSGQRREGTFGAIFGWIQKMGGSLAFLGTGVALNWVGFHSSSGAEQSPEAFTGMRLMLSGGTVAASLLGMAALVFYPINRARAEATSRILAARRGAL